MSDVFDFKKEYKDLYLPKQKPMRIHVPKMSFLAVDGEGDPNGDAYQNAVSALYSISYTIKMSKMGQSRPAGYFDYVVPPLEGLWWTPGPFELFERADWLWSAMIRQPEFVNSETLAWAKEQSAKKKPDIDTSVVTLTELTEGDCVQMMHIGPFATEPETLAAMHAYMEAQGLRDDVGSVRKHHEIYLNDPRKTAPDKLKTVLRHPVAVK